MDSTVPVTSRLMVDRRLLASAQTDHILATLQGVVQHFFMLTLDNILLPKNDGIRWKLLCLVIRRQALISLPKKASPKGASVYFAEIHSRLSRMAAGIGKKNGRKTRERRAREHAVTRDCHPRFLFAFGSLSTPCTSYPLHRLPLLIRDEQNSSEGRHFVPSWRASRTGSRQHASTTMIVIRTCANSKSRGIRSRTTKTTTWSSCLQSPYPRLSRVHLARERRSQFFTVRCQINLFGVNISEVLFASRGSIKTELNNPSRHHQAPSLHIHHFILHITNCFHYTLRVV
jgi:hypothetical protein